ncbi:L-threonylcarbamoyladenylate synthase [Limnofasciculus baicalensis]|uniref:L-threonylcarbamoyladenylate synthase n=1 Tax=Limnofasciculus baicalensis BBK-W-15 TaxID=2699891 RepID=A0AAE3GWF2_9CYAN|nr:L-threonylcarbamoyladenylate synthase [Limnofasciculus baicalensis]MCP2731951.1 L-threonylcarbamoyladenylate synthase [Limnofasciculus baicalensis BBK-W-15]
MTQVSMSTLVAEAEGGEVVSFPTDTVPALAVRPDRSELIFIAKKRPPDKPLILMAGNPADLWHFVKGSDTELATWQEVAAKYWPGGLTLVLPASDRVPAAMNPTDPTTIGVRVPNSEVAIAILSQTGPLATTSANFSGKPPLKTVGEIEAEFPECLTLHPSELEKFPPVTTGVPSTVAKWTSNGWEILRQGEVRLEG